MGDWDSTGTVVYSFDRYFDANPQQLERIGASVGAEERDAQGPDCWSPSPPRCATTSRARSTGSCPSR